MDIKGKNVAILATNGFEQSELEVPRDRLAEHGATVHIVSPEAGEIRGWAKKVWGGAVKVDVTLDKANPDDIETGIAKGRRMTSYKSIMINAGAKWEDSDVVADQGIVTSRQPSDLEAFSRKVMEEIAEGQHARRAA